MKKSNPLLMGTAALMLFLTLLAATAFALSGMVIRVSGDRITINRGLRDSMAPDQELYVHRIGKAVAKIKVILVDSTSSEAQVVKLESDETVKVGDVVSTEPFSVPYTPPPPATRETGDWKTAPGKQNSSDPSNAYLQMVKDQTKIATFKSGPKGHVKVGMGEASLILSALPHSYAGIPAYTYADPWMLFTIGTQLYNQYNTSRNVGPHSTVLVAMTYYSDALVDAQARYFAYKEGITGEAAILEVKQGIIQQMGTDQNLVFCVKVNNQGSTVLQLAPFKWHMYVINGSGKQIKATRYEEALDKAVGPKQETQGFVYFPKTDDAGLPNSSGNQVRVKLDTILGGNTDVTWK